jgi:hypothetical protein
VYFVAYYLQLITIDSESDPEAGTVPDKDIAPCPSGFDIPVGTGMGGVGGAGAGAGAGCGGADLVTAIVPGLEIGWMLVELLKAQRGFASTAVVTKTKPWQLTPIFRQAASHVAIAARFVIFCGSIGDGFGRL